MQQNEANSRHAHCPLAVSSKTATACRTPQPFSGTFFPLGAQLISLPRLWPRSRCVPCRLHGQCVPEPAGPAASAYSQRTRVRTGGKEAMNYLGMQILAAVPWWKPQLWLYGKPRAYEYLSCSPSEGIQHSHRHESEKWFFFLNVQWLLQKTHNEY